MHTYNEITNQAEQLQKTLDIVEQTNFERLEVDQVIFTGCGTSFYLASSAARYYQSVTGRFAIAVPASELFLHQSSLILTGKKYLVVGISRSGTTSEIIIALDQLKEKDNIQTLAITCNGDTPMAEMADYVIALDHVSEQSVVMTQSFSNMMYALQLYAIKMSPSEEDFAELRKVPTLVSAVIKNGMPKKRIANDLTKKRFIFLGSGQYNGLAKEATLKLKEMTQTECESYSSLEFRHGPISIVDDSTVVILLAQHETANYDQALVTDIERLGGHVLVIGPVNAGFQADQIIELDGDISDRNRYALYVPILQMLAYERAIRLGFNPDQPRNLTQVVKLA
ncbi:SIS domain-containing protein [Sporosarcina sp. Te-1]|uniref:SIS domain-containing protein n=1 Tax=Sporosarcina sp. Te-1 TaxID=2818390 RepID=UPI001A9EF531|nr:SIS domain-containing protein [Sporosarcina sp. Te-1]QTD40972.1 SIS domain-containing protein [Sporosarcina sp. Te-1]